MKRLVSLMLAGLMVMGLPACALGAPGDGADPVTDGYTYTNDYGEKFRIPMVTVEGPGAAAVNAAIWRDLYEGYMYDVQYAAESGEGSYLMGVDYSWAVSGDILSVLATVRYEANDLCDYFVYNVSLTDGERLSDRELFQALGIDRQRFNELLRSAVGAVYDGFSGMTDGDFIETQRAASLAGDAIARAMPYLGQDGTLCAAGLIYPVAGPERCYHLFTLTDQ